MIYRDPVLPHSVGGDLQRAFLKFHREHPEVWRAIVRFTFEAISAGRSHYSMDAVVHRVRWETSFGDNRPEREFKIANAHVAFYSRVWRDTYPEYGDFFRYQKKEAA